MALYDIFLPDSLRKPSADDPQELTGSALVDYLVDHPDTKGIFHLRGFTTGLIARLLARSPHFADQCDFSKITRRYAAAIIVAQPSFLDRFDPAKVDWKTVLRCRPELIKSLPARNRMNKSAWHDILCHQPGLWNDSPFQHFDTYEWCRLICCQPQLAVKCPWKTLDFHPDWKIDILLYPDLILPRREDWRPYYSLSGFDSRQIARLLAKAPHLETLIEDFSIFTPADWIKILKSQPQLIEHCDVKKIFPSPPLELLAEQPGLADRFDWGNCNYQPHLMRFIHSQPQLVPRVLHLCRNEHWEYLLQEHPEYFLKRDCRQFSLRSNVRASLLVGLLDFDETGLDPICNRIYDILQKETRTLKEWYDRNYIYTPGGMVCRFAFTPAELMIESVMDFTNAECYFTDQLRKNNWDFIVGLLDCGPEAISEFLSPEETAFLCSFAAPEKMWRKYLDRCDAAAVRDKKGNTLLHAALLRAVFEDIGSLCGSNDPPRNPYAYLLARGCDPDRKNKRGVSCNDLLRMLRKKVERLKGVEP